MSKIIVSNEVYAGIEAVRASGLTNMFDRDAVAELASSMGYGETSEWVKNHAEEYAYAIIYGVAVEGVEYKATYPSS